jgi:hypothetical protein
MLSITKYIMEQEELKKPEEKSIGQKILDKAKKVGDTATEVGAHLGNTIMLAGQATGNRHLSTVGAFLPAINGIKRQFKAG